MRYRNVCLSRMHSRKAMNVCLKPTVNIEAPGGSANPGLRCSKKNQGMAHSTARNSQSCGPCLSSQYSRHTPPEKAIKTLKPLVLFSVLWSDLRPLRIPTIIASITISPAEQTAKEMFDTRLRAIDSKCACSTGL